MANLETLELTINANAESVSNGLEKLIRSLSLLSHSVGKSVGALKQLNTQLATLKGYGKMNFGIGGSGNGSVQKINNTTKAFKAQASVLKEFRNLKPGEFNPSMYGPNPEQKQTIKVAPETSLAKVKNTMKDTVPISKRVENAISKIGNGFKTLRKGIADIIPKFNLLNRVMRIASTMLIRMGVKALFKGAKEGFDNFYQYSKATGGTFAKEMDGVYSAWQQIKNQLGASLATAFSAAIPVINALANAAITAFNYLSQLIALLTGKSSWTKATAQVADYSDAINKANGKGSGGGGMKELLANFDELNVIAQESSGGGGGAANTAKDFTNMFEEMTEFDSKIKDLVEWLENHLPVVNGLIAGLAAALLGLPASISVGIGLLITGIGTSYDAGKDIGLNGLNTENFLKACLGILETTFGGGLIGWKLGGLGGAAIGATIGFTIGLASLGVGMAFGEKLKLYGQLHWEAEKIKQEVNSLFKFDDIWIQIEKMQLDHQKLEDAKKDVRDALIDFEKEFSWDIIKVGVNNAESLKKMNDSVQNLVKYTNLLIAARQETIEVGLKLTTQFDDDPQAVIDFSKEKFGGIQTYVEDLGKEISKILEDGITIDEAKTIEKLKGQISRITAAIEGGRLAGNFASNVQRGYSGSTWENLDAETLSAYMGQYTEAVAGYKDALYQQAYDTKESLGALYYAMVEQNKQKPGSYSDADIEKARQNFMNFNIDKDVEDKWQYYGEEGRQIFTRNVNEAISAVIGRKENWNSTMATKTVLKGKLKNLKKWLVTNIADNIQFDEKILANAFDLMEITGWEVLGEDVRKNMIYTMQKQFGIGSDLYSALKSQLNVPIDDILATNQNAWDKWKVSEKLKFVTALVEAYGSQETLKAAKNAGIDVQAAIDEGLASDNGNTRKAAQKLVGMIQDEVSKKEIIVNAVAKLKTEVNATVNVQTNFFDKVKNATIGKATTILDTVGTLLSVIQTRAKGGFVGQGDLFIANEKGAELVGSIGGSTAVANQGQIIEGIQRGVYEANSEQNALLRRQNELLQGILEKDASVRIGASAALGRVARQSLDMYSGITGG